MNSPVKCLICLGSNHLPQANIHRAMEALSALFPDIVWGTPVTTPAEGHHPSDTAPNYTNLAATFTTTLTPDEIKRHFKQIENSCGRTPRSKATGIIPLDIDLLIHGDTVLKPSDLKTAYVIRAVSAIL